MTTIPTLMFGLIMFAAGIAIGIGVHAYVYAGHMRRLRDRLQMVDLTPRL